MIKFRSGKTPCCRLVSLLVCLLLLSGLLLSFSPQQAGAEGTGVNNLAAQLQGLYGSVRSNPENSAASLATLLTVYDNAENNLSTYDVNSGTPWSTVFSSSNLGTGLQTLVSKNMYPDVTTAAVNVSYFLRDFARLVYFGSQGTYTSSVLDSFWNKAHSPYSTETNAVTLEKIIGVYPNPPANLEDQFCSYVVAAIGDIPDEVANLTGTQFKGYTFNFDLTDTETNLFVRECIMDALDNTAKGTYALFAPQASGAGWAFGGDLIDKGYRYVDQAISLVGGITSAGEVILVYSMPYYPPVPPPVAPFLARYPGFVDLNETYPIPGLVSGKAPASFVVPAPDAATLKAAEAQGMEERVYYYNQKYNMWVALASYPQPDGSVLVINDGGYSNAMTELFAVWEPHYTDVTGYWAEDTINRMNGLALIEGYPILGNTDPLARTAGPDRQMTRAEFVTAFMRALGCLPPAEKKLYGVSQPLGQTSNQVLSGMTGIPVWSRDFVAGAVYCGLVSGEGNGSFAGDDPITRIQAAIIVSSFLKRLPNYTPADLSQFADAADVPSWARDAVADGVLTGYPDKTLQPNNPITRAEAYVTFLKLLRALGW
jgi:hypothetical protein